MEYVTPKGDNREVLAERQAIIQFKFKQLPIQAANKMIQIGEACDYVLSIMRGFLNSLYII